MKSVLDIMAEIEVDRQKAGEEVDEQRVVLAAAMTSAGVARVEIEFSGDGDEGQIHNIVIAMHSGHKEPEDLKEAVENWAYKFLEGTGVDWHNNEGGQGEITFDLTTAPIHFSAFVDVNETVSTRAYELEEGA